MSRKAICQATPLAYKDKAIEATLSGYHAAFYVAAAFSLVGFFFAFTLKKKEPALKVLKGGANQ